MEVDIAVNDASLETILRVCSASTNDNGSSMVNVSQFLDLCEYTRIPRSTYLSESNDGDVDVEVDRTDDSINGDSDGAEVVKATQQYRPDSPDSLNGLGPGKELTVSTRLTTTIANDSNNSDDTCSLGSSKSDRVPVSSSSAPLASAEVVKTIPTSTINSSSGGSSNGILTHPPSKHTRSVSPGAPSSATALTMKPTTATGGVATAGVAATAPSSSSLKKVSKVAEGNGKTTTVPFRSQRPASADPRMTMRSRTTPTPTPTSTTGTQQPQHHHHLQQKYPPSQEQQRRKPSPAAPHPNRPSSSTATAAHSTRDRASFGPDSSKTRASFGPDSTRARARADDVSDMEKFLGFGYGLTSSYDLPPHGTKSLAHGTKLSAHPGRQSLSMSMTASLRGPRDTQSPTRIERSNHHHNHSLSHNYNDYHNSNYNHSNHLITASSSISSSGIGRHVPFRSQSQSAGEFPVFTTLCLDTLKHLEVPLSCILLS